MDDKPVFTPLLNTKFYCPQPRPNLVSRDRLLQELETGLYHGGNFNRKLTLVSAPAGYGKTTLIAEWLHQPMFSGSDSHQAVGPTTIPQPTRVAWLSLDEGDNDPARFLTYVISALQRVDSSIGATALSILQSPQPPEMEIVLTTVINDIAAAADPIILAIDDYHVITTPPIHELITFLLDHLPNQIHLVMMTREDPLLPIARLRAREHLVEIRQDDLRFTTEESADFLEGVMGLSLTPDEIAALERRTEGWIAGLQLAAVSMRGREDLPAFIQAFTGSSRFILDYLIEEVYKHQTPELQEFLLKTSILERLSSPLCDAVAGVTVSQETLESLEQSNLFIVPIDQSRLWYRYHRLFAELLHYRLEMSEIDETELHQQASLWFETKGFIHEAVGHALSARDWDRAAALIGEVLDATLKRGEVLTLVHWFQAFPEEILQSNPKLCFDYCWPLLLTTQYDLAAPLLDRVEKQAQGHPVFLGEIYAAQAYLARGQGEHARMVERSQAALKLLPKTAVSSRCIVAVNLGIAYWHMGQMEAAVEVLGEALESGKATENHYAVLTALIFLGRVFAVRGQFQQARGYFERSLQYGDQIPINALAYMDLATLHYEWNALDLSDDHLQKAIAICQRTQNDEFLVGALMIQSRLRVAQGDVPGAEAALEQAWGLVHAGKIPAQTAERLDVAQVRLLLAKGEPLGELGLKLTEQLDCHPFYRFLGLTKAWVLPAPHTRAYLDGLGQAAQINEWHYGLVAVRAVQAVLAEDQDAGLDFLLDALNLAKNGGYIRTFVEAGERLVPLLRKAATQGFHSDYAEQILAAMGDLDDGRRTENEGLIEPLSPRELEVLQLVTAGRSNREIAAALVISTGTAKTHVHNLCGKLGVRNRTEAATKAIELGLV